MFASSSDVRNVLIIQKKNQLNTTMELIEYDQIGPWKDFNEIKCPSFIKHKHTIGCRRVVVVVFDYLDTPYTGLKNVELFYKQYNRTKFFFINAIRRYSRNNVQMIGLNGENELPRFRVKLGFNKFLQDEKPVIWCRHISKREATVLAFRKVFNIPNDVWTISFFGGGCGNAAASNLNAKNNFLSNFYTPIHEIGHLLGFGHSSLWDDRIHKFIGYGDRLSNMGRRIAWNYSIHMLWYNNWLRKNEFIDNIQKNIMYTLFVVQDCYFNENNNKLIYLNFNVDNIFIGISYERHRTIPGGFGVIIYSQKRLRASRRLKTITTPGYHKLDIDNNEFIIHVMNMNKEHVDFMIIY